MDGPLDVAGGVDASVALDFTSDGKGVGCL